MRNDFHQTSTQATNAKNNIILSLEVYLFLQRKINTWHF